MSFQRDLKRFADQRKMTVSQAYRGVSIKLFEGTIMGTPVLEGRARGGWIASVGAPASGEGSADKSGAATVAKMMGTVSDSQPNFLTNNLPYIGRLEYQGWSDQAPSGMVRINMARVQKNLADAVKEAER